MTDNFIQRIEQKISGWQDTSEKQESTEDGKMLQATDIAAAVIYALSQEKRCVVVEMRIPPHLQLI